MTPLEKVGGRMRCNLFRSPGMARQVAKRRKLNPQLAAKLKEMAGELRTMLYGAAGGPQPGAEMGGRGRRGKPELEHLGRSIPSPRLRADQGIRARPHVCVRRRSGRPRP